MSLDSQFRPENDDELFTMTYHLPVEEKSTIENGIQATKISGFPAICSAASFAVTYFAFNLLTEMIVKRTGTYDFFHGLEMPSTYVGAGISVLVGAYWGNKYYGNNVRGDNK